MLQLLSVRLTTVVLVAVVVTVQVSVAPFARQDAAARPTLKVAWGALCCHGNAPKTATAMRIKSNLTGHIGHNVSLFGTVNCFQTS